MEEIKVETEPLIHELIHPQSIHWLDNIMYFITLEDKFVPDKDIFYINITTLN